MRKITTAGLVVMDLLLPGMMSYIKLMGPDFLRVTIILLTNQSFISGRTGVTDIVQVKSNIPITVGQLILSPTRTFAPVMKALLEKNFDAINGLIHCSGGGQTKCLKYLPGNMRVVKDNLFDPPVIFQLIQAASKADDREMYQVFNMGTRLEIYTNEVDAAEIIAVAAGFGVDAQVIGRVEESDKKELVIKTSNGELQFN